MKKAGKLKEQAETFESLVRFTVLMAIRIDGCVDSCVYCNDSVLCLHPVCTTA